MATAAAQARCDFVIVCAGAPKRSMGWYHCQQLLDGEVPGARLADVVEPWLMGGGAGGAGSADFGAWRSTAEARGVRFWASVAELPSAADRESPNPRVALIAGRAADCPALFEAVLAHGVDHICLENQPSDGEHEGGGEGGGLLAF